LRNEAHPEDSPCIRCDTCDGFPCLVDAKADAETMCVNPARQLSNFTLLTHTRALRLETDSSGKQITGVLVDRSGIQETYRARQYIISCGAIQSAALLLRSKNDKHPHGLANSSGLVGTHYMCHLNSALLALSSTLNDTQFQKTFGLNDFYYASPAWKYPMGHIQLLGNVKHEMLRGSAPFFVPDALLKTTARHAVGWWLSSEDLPDPANRVTLDAQSDIVLHYRPNNEEGHKRLVRKLKQLLSSMELTLSFAQRMPIGAVAHQVGTCRFGTDPSTSVLDPTCKAHDLSNLYVVDGSFFPSSGAVNPGLTIAANALRVADLLIKQSSKP
jgi:choline dehydrogenase-like flavoprotein